MDQPAWLTAAWGELGVREGAGAADNARVLAYYREAGHQGIAHDEVAWCAAFTGAMLKRAGLEGTGSLMARSYLAWGERLSTPRPGAIAVLERGSDPAAGHVAFVAGVSEGKIILLGGNQSDSVCVAAYDSGRVLGYRWPAAAQSETQGEGVTAQLPASAFDTDSVFDEALAHVLQQEGGFSDDHYDPGGPTNRGITLAVYARFKGVTVDATSRARLVDDLKRIPDASVRAIYKARYWDPAHCAAMPPPVALFHFDAAVNHGVTGAARLLQKALGVTNDGAIGPLTLSALSLRDAQDLITGYAAIRRDRYRALPHFWRFGRGWLKRVDASAARAATLIAMTDQTTETRKGGSAMEQSDETTTEGKWWGHSKTVWGALITAAAAVAPALGPLIGVDLPEEAVRQAGEQTLNALQAAAGLFGTLLTIYGRFKAAGPLERRSVSMRL